MAVTYNKFNQFTDDLLLNVHNLGSDALKLMLSNTAPSASNTVLSNITEITTGHGYSAGGIALSATISAASGTARLFITDATLTASGGSIGPFQYMVIYNSTPTSPLKPLICWIDNGATITLTDGQQITFDFDGTNGLFGLA